ncbi:MAG: hypothetical protein U9R14_03730 [Patescibacteria group bacterium]|nr:hypothetical protein [Patescibacteria group bacterium]
MSSSKARSYPFKQSEHLDKARKNEQLARAFFDLESPCCDWIITICFYSAIHYIYSKLPINYIQNSHYHLEEEIVKHFPRTGIYKLFKSLKDKSEDMRYYPYSANLFKNDRQFCSYRFKELEKIKKILKI